MHEIRVKWDPRNGRIELFAPENIPLTESLGILELVKELLLSRSRKQTTESTLEMPNGVIPPQVMQNLRAR